MKIQYLAMIQTSLDDYPMRLFASENAARQYLDTCTLAELERVEGTVFKRDEAGIVCGSIVTFEEAQPVRFETVEVPQLTDVRGD